MLAYLFTYILKVPDEMDLETASGMRIAGRTADQSLREVVEVEPGDTVLIHSAAGGVGTFAVQIAHDAGATVIATASSPEKHAYLKSIGADYVFQSRTLEFVEDIKAVRTRGLSRFCLLLSLCKRP